MVFQVLTGSSYSYNAAYGELVSHNTVDVANQKAVWTKPNGLGDAKFSEGSADIAGNQSLIQNLATVLAESNGSLDSTLNQLSYPNSTYENVAGNMPASSSAPAAAPSFSLLTSTVSVTCRQHPLPYFILKEKPL